MAGFEVTTEGNRQQSDVPKQALNAVFSIIRRQSQQLVVKLAAATVNRRVVGSNPT
jgi:hypothetical protein